MRLIDGDKMQEWAFEFNFAGRITERELYLFNRAIEEMPTVEAVPVSFLEKLRDNAQNEEAALMIDEIIAQWRLNL